MKKLAYIGLAFLLLGACQREMDNIRQDAALSFSVRSAGEAVKSGTPEHLLPQEQAIATAAGDTLRLWAREESIDGACTKASIYDGTSLPEDVSIGFTAYKYENSGAAASAWALHSSPAVMEAVYDGSRNGRSKKWVPTTRLLWPGSGYVKYFAYAPFEASGATVTAASGAAPSIAYTVPATYDEQVDLLVADAASSCEYEGDPLVTAIDVPLTFNHVLTAIRFRVGKGLSISSVSIRDVYNKGTLSLGAATRSWTLDNASKATYTLTSPTLKTDPTDSDYSIVNDEYTLILMPQTLPAGTIIEATVTDGISSKTLSAIMDGEIWEPGKLITYTITTLGNVEVPPTTPLTIEPCEEGTTKITIPNPNGLTYKWSIDGAAKESSADNPIIINADKGQKVALYQDSAVALGFDMITDGIQISKLSYVYGNVMSLASETGYASLKTCVDHQFQYLFSWYKGNRLLLHPTEPLVLPATTLAEACYESMFEYCTAMDRAPALPATTLAIDCYKSMFWGCESLKSAPALPATTLADYCYNGMFLGCESLTSAPSLPAATLAEGCYAAMFSECRSLTSAPALPATVMADRCYSGMFRLCESLTTAPFLPATQLAPRCYRNMFQDCTSLETPPAELPATALPGYCYQSMFDGCTSLTTAPVIRATTLSEWSCWSMFLDCSSLVSVQDELYATVMEDRCYESMFERCTSLTTAPALPATTLAEECYSYMFQGCSSLTSAPVLPATVAATNCYMNMFEDCTSLSYVECNLLDRNDSNGYCCTDFWLWKTAATGTFKKNPAATWPYNHQTAPDNNEYHGVPAGWTIVDIQ